MDIFWNFFFDFWSFVFIPLSVLISFKGLLILCVICCAICCLSGACGFLGHRRYDTFDEDA